MTFTRRHEKFYKGNDVHSAENFLNSKSYSSIELDFYMAGEDWKPGEV